jgi:hypothetical protein
MAAQTLVEVVLQNWPAVLGVALAAYLISNRFNHGLNKYPGPFLASLTDWWRFWIVYKRRPEVEHIRLHEKHGDVVRLGPNVLSFSDPKALKTIYGLNKGFTKVMNAMWIPTDHLTDTVVVRILPSTTISGEWSPPALAFQHHLRSLPRAAPTKCE